ncbi:MAG: regulatory protein RecX [Saprospiraceae bacterium]
MAYQRAKPEKPLTPDEALLALERYCAYRERSPHEVRQKLKALGQSGDTAEQLYHVLETDNYFNEQRYAEAYAGGKFRINHWGRVRIRMGLQQQHIGNATIETALACIESTEYETVLQQLLQRKLAQWAHEDLPTAKHKTIQGLIRQGFEPELIFLALKSASET